jgi:hypothetical protein
MQGNARVLELEHALGLRLGWLEGARSKRRDELDVVAAMAAVELGARARGGTAAFIGQ